MAKRVPIPDGEYLKGLAEVTGRLNSRLDQMEGAALKGIHEIALDIMLRAKENAPNNKSDLRESAKADESELKGGRIMSAIRFTAPYAANQHEHTEYAHTDGKAKYLESAVIEKQNQYLCMLADSLQGPSGG